MSLADRIAEAAAALPKNAEAVADGDDHIELVAREEGAGDEGLDYTQEATDSSEEDPDGDGVEDTTDDDEDTVEAPAPRADVRQETFSQMVRNVARKERELASERQARRAEQQEIVRLKSELAAARPSEDLDADDVEVAQDRLMRRFKTQDPRDPRVVDALKEYVTDLTALAYEEADAVDAFKGRNEQRRQSKAERDRFKAYDRRIAEIEAESLRHRETAQTAQLTNAASQYLTTNAAKTPFLTAATEAGEIVPVEFIVQAARKGVDEGLYRDPQSMAELGQLYGLIAANLEEHYRVVAEKLQARLGGSPRSGLISGQQKQQKSGQRVPPAQARGSVAKKAQGTRGGGGRGSAQPVPAEEEGRKDLASRIRAAERKLRARD